MTSSAEATTKDNSHDAYRRAWWRKFRAQGHKPIKVGGYINIFVTDSGYHNGPGCTKCGWTACWHCSGPEDIPKCVTPERRKPK